MAHLLQGLERSADPSKQIEWLNRYGWKYAVTAANRPIVGRVYARWR
ncbi:hypothetical protein [Pseudomonas phage vB_Pae_BR144a]|nr:hypothetical protein [Pseudomonas phage vB_Pae_BR144a]